MVQAVYEDSVSQLMGTAALILVGAITVGGVASMGGVWWLRARRERRVRTEAESEGWPWRQSEPGLVDAWPLAPFGTGNRRTAWNVIRLQHRGRSCVVFDYCSVVGHREESRRQDVSVSVLTLPGALPTIQIGPEDAPKAC